MAKIKIYVLGNKILQGITIALVIFVLTACAKVGSPSGGPRDTTPPKVMHCEPANYSANCEADQIEVHFNEFVQLRNISEELIVSPPVKKDPEVVNKGKHILINFRSPLADSTTYTLDFGDAIVDFREGNPLGRFKYVFSTGNVVDSLAVYGRVLNAFDLQPPREKCWVMLHENLEDSAFYVDTPSYIGRTDSKGYFDITHVSHDTFQLFALKDVNANLMYDLPNEQIAFYDSLLVLDKRYFYPKKQPDTMQTDTMSPDTSENDTLMNAGEVMVSADTGQRDSAAKDTAKWESKKDMAYDTIYQRKFTPKQARPVNLYLFREQVEQDQYLKEYVRESPYKLTVAFNLPLQEKKPLRLIEPQRDEDADWYVREQTPGEDTLIYWITDTSIAKRQKIVACQTYQKEDSLGKTYMFDDTLTFTYDVNSGKEQKEEYPLELETNIKNNGKLDLNKLIRIQTERPIRQYDTSLIQMYRKQDTLEIPIDYTLQQQKMIHGEDTLPGKRHFKLAKTWDPETSYTLKCMPGGFKDIIGARNDTTTLHFSTYAKDYYGLIRVEVDTTPVPLLFQLWDEKENRLYEQDLVKQTGNVIFDYLHPGTYRIKVVYDQNEDQQWTTGNYEEKRQPEEVIYYKGTIKVRSNWDTELEW